MIPVLIGEKEYLYNIEIITQFVVVGWIFNVQEHEKISISVYHDGNSASTMASRKREDLISIEKRDGFCGFSLDLSSFTVEQIRNCNVKINNVESEDLTSYFLNLFNKYYPVDGIVKDEDRFLLNLDSLTNYNLSGWFVDRTNNDDAILSVYHKSFGEIQVYNNIPRQDLVNSGITDRPAGFNTDLPIMSKQFIDELEVRLNSKRNDFLTSYLKKRSVIYSQQNIDNIIEGYIDDINPENVVGWVMDRRGFPSLNVEIRNSDAVLGSTVSNLMRKDLEDAGKLQPNSGFSVSLPENLTLEEFKDLEIFVNGFYSDRLTKVFQLILDKRYESIGYKVKIRSLQVKLKNLNRKANLTATCFETINNLERITDSTELTNENKVLEIKGVIDSFNLGNIVHFSGDDYDENKKAFEVKCEEILQRDLASGINMDFSSSLPPKVSIVLVLYNKACLTYQCLKSLLPTKNEIEYELVVVDNDSSDDSERLFGNITGVKYIRNNENVGFLKACNQARKYVNSEYILLLNNDSIVNKNSVLNAYNRIIQCPSFGVVGGKILHLDGKLQEAGSIIWNDGTCLGYGRRDNPDLSFYNYVRSVDYVSGAFFLTRTQVWDDLGGFDEALAPCYYEETDFCVRVIQSGLKVVYEPSASIVHFEFGSSSESDFAFKQMEKNKLIFQAKHKQFLRLQNSPSVDNIHSAANRNDKPILLYIDDQVPFDQMGSGFPRAKKIIRELMNNFNVVVLPFCENKFYGDLKCYDGVHLLSFKPEIYLDYLKDIVNDISLIWISRPHNMQKIIESDRLNFLLSKGIPVVYDAEALFSEREKLRSHVFSLPFDDRLLETEVELLNTADFITAVSSKDQMLISDKVAKPVFKISHPVQTSYHQDLNNKPQKTEILFVGNLSGQTQTSPNVDSIDFFLDNYGHLLEENNVVLRLVGRCDEENAQKWSSKNVIVNGVADDLTLHFDKAFFSIAPTRFAAGIPHKVHESLSRGVPVLGTELILEQCGIPILEEFGVLSANNITRLIHNSAAREKLLEKQLEYCSSDMSERDFEIEMKELISRVQDNVRWRRNEK